MTELGVGHIILGCKDKIAALDRILEQLNLKPAQAAYAGDDLPDLPLLQYAGTSFAVANAMPEVQAACDYTTRARGGQGAVREICDLLTRSLPV